MNKIKLGVIVILVLLAACTKKSVYYNNKGFQVNLPDSTKNKELEYSVYLIGDVGADTIKSSPALKLLKKELNFSNQDKTAVVFLGDNIYPEGLHKKKHDLRGQDEDRIDIQLNAITNFKGEVVFIPGNHDWKQGDKKGLEYIKRQEDYIEKKFDHKIFKPSKGCSGPDDIELSNSLTLILIDTQWWLHKHDKSKGDKDGCDNSTKAEFMTAFKELLKKNRNKNVIVAGHHPLYSNGRHGGYYTFKDHFFPLTNVSNKLWIPLPVLGSLFPFYRSFFGNIQDLPNPKYQEMRQELTTAMNEYDNVIYVAGHEHNLQYVNENRLHHIVSGAGSKVSSLRYNKKLDFGAERRGIAKIELFHNGDVYLKYIDAIEGQKVLWEKKLYTKEVKEFKDLSSTKKISYKGKYQLVVPDSNYEAGPLKRLFFGDLNRDLWTKSLKVPYLDIHYDFGGLKPIGKGGGMQTLSLKMEGGDGRVYKLRGIKKNADFLVGKDLRGTIAQDIIYDGIAGSHPYASVAVPKFAEAADIYYSVPSLVYVPKDSILGDYINEFGGMFCLLEIHADNDMREYENFGNSKKIINYSKAIENLQEKSSHQVDASYAVRARLLDLLLGDWDRHDDQWRWATFKEKDQTIYRPIPRDRDQVFFKFDGVIMKIANRKWLLRKFQHFKGDIRDVAGLSFNARYFDRYFLIAADRSVWQEEAKKLKNQITDSIILNALQDLPKEAFEYNGNELYELLKARRDKLESFANRYYSILSKSVDLRGTLGKDYFEIIRLANGDVKVNIYVRKKGIKKGKPFYTRLFKYEETKEVNIYGIDDQDEYNISGETNKSILIRIIAGENKDKVTDKSFVKGPKKKTQVYDVKGKLDIEKSKETSLEVRSKEDAYFYDRKEFKYNALIPIPSIGANPDDGFFIGPGFKYIKRGFKKSPYKYSHDFAVNYAFKAKGINLKYKCDYVDLLGKVDVGGEFRMNLPHLYQFYGIGNETKLADSEIGESAVEIENYELNSNFSISSKDNSRRLIATVGYQIVGLESVPLDAVVFSKRENQEFLKIGLKFNYVNVDNLVNPTKGIKFQAGVANASSMVNEDVSFYKLSSNLSLYVPINYFRKQTTLAIRSGFATNEGDYNFYHANFLSGLNEFRGVTRNRFAGETVSYSNIDLRKSFFKVRNYVAPFDFGVLGHFDVGRVWIGNDSDNSSKWHNSYGAGVYLNVLNYIALVGTYSISDVDKVFNLGTKFYF